MDINRYRRLSAEGLAKFEPPAHLSFKRFDPESGKELDPELQFVSKEALEQREQELSDELETVIDLLAKL